MKKIIFGVLAGVGAVLLLTNVGSIMGGDGINMEAAVPVIIGAFLLVFGLKNMFAAGNHSKCKCGYKYDYEDDVAHSVVKDWVTQGNDPKSMIRLKFSCTCRRCHKDTEFTQDFVRAVVRNGKVVERDVHAEIRKIFK